MYEIIENREDMLIVRDWLYENGRDDEVEKIEYLIKNDKWPFKTESGVYYWANYNMFEFYSYKPKYGWVKVKNQDFFDDPRYIIMFTRNFKILYETIEYFCKFAII